MNPNVSAILDNVEPELQALCRRFGVLRLSLFGSAMTPNWDAEMSDLDFVVDFDTPPAGLDLFAQQFVFQVELEALLQKPVDLVERSAIRKPLFRSKVEEQAKAIYAA